MKKVLCAMLILVCLAGGVWAAGTPETLEKGLGMTPTQFMNKFNVFTKSNKIPISIPTISLTSGNVNDTFTHKFSGNLILIGVVQKADKTLLSLTMLATPKTNDESTSLLLIYGAIMSAINPELSEKQRGALLKGLIQDLDGNLAENNEAVRGSIKYVFVADNIIGLQLYVTNVNEISTTN